MGLVSWHHHAHLIESTIAVLALILGPLAVCWALRAHGAFAVVSLATGVVTASLSLALLLAEHQSYVGLVQRGLALTSMAWIGILGAWLFTTTRRPRVPYHARRDVPG